MSKTKKKRYKSKKQVVDSEKKKEKEVKELSEKEKSKKDIKDRIDQEDVFFIYWAQGDVTWSGLPNKASLIGFLQNSVYQDFNNPIFSNLYRHLYGAKAEDLGDKILDVRTHKNMPAQIPASATLVEEGEEVEEVVEESEGEGIIEEEVESSELEEVYEDEGEEEVDEEELDEELTEEELAIYEKLKAKLEK